MQSNEIFILGKTASKLHWIEASKGRERDVDYENIFLKENSSGSISFLPQKASTVFVKKNYLDGDLKRRAVLSFG